MENSAATYPLLLSTCCNEACQQSILTFIIGCTCISEFSYTMAKWHANCFAIHHPLGCHISIHSKWVFFFRSHLWTSIACCYTGSSCACVLKFLIGLLLYSCIKFYFVALHLLSTAAFVVSMSLLGDPVALYQCVPKVFGLYEPLSLLLIRLSSNSPPCPFSIPNLQCSFLRLRWDSISFQIRPVWGRTCHPVSWNNRLCWQWYFESGIKDLGAYYYLMTL